MRILAPFIEAKSFDGRFVLTRKGRLAKELQRTVGDILMNTDEESITAVEVKAERKNKYGNLFLETWSNRSRFTLGWMYTLNTDLLLYHFIEDDQLWVCNFQKLKGWAFQQGAKNFPNLFKHPEREQAEYEQMNDTWGRCVPISALVKDIGMRLYRPSTGDEDNAWTPAHPAQASFLTMMEVKATPRGSSWSVDTAAR
jgi:hypothetical protein